MATIETIDDLPAFLQDVAEACGSAVDGLEAMGESALKSDDPEWQQLGKLIQDMRSHAVALKNKGHAASAVAQRIVEDLR